MHDHTIAGTTGGMSANDTGEIKIGSYKNDAESPYAKGNLSYINFGSSLHAFETGTGNTYSQITIKSNVAHTHTLPANTGSSGGVESKPINLTTKLWRRIA